MEQKPPMESRKIRYFQTKPFFHVDEASSFVLDDNTSTRLADGQLPEAEYPMAKKHLNYAVFKAMMPRWPIIEMKGL